MTRKSRRELERAVEDLTNGRANGDVDQRVQNYIEVSDSVDWGGPLIEFRDDDGEVTTRLGGSDNLLLTTGGCRYFAPPEDVPSWIGSEADLPVRV